MIDTFGISMFCIFIAIIIFCVYKGFNPGKNKKDPSQPAREIENPDEFWLEAKKEAEKELLQSLIPNDEILKNLQEGLSRKENMLIRGENIAIGSVRSSLNSVSVFLHRDFMGIYRIWLGIEIHCWDDEVRYMAEDKTKMYGFSSSNRSRYGYCSNTDNHRTLLRGWMTWLSEKISEDSSFTILYSPWDIFRDREKRIDEIVFCSAGAYVNKFSVKGTPADVYKQLLSFSEEMKTKLEKEYIDSIGFFSRKISDYLSETVLKNITVKELKGESIIDLTQSQDFVGNAILELDKNDFVLKLKLKKPGVDLDGDKLLVYVKENLFNFFSDYGKPVEIIEEESNYDLQIWNGCIKEGNPHNLVTEGHFYFVLRVKEIGEDLHS
ncbi:hypothetical protein [Klebsiella pneumoniae]|uniref:hypothetical protein n=1 Tax=Klebsiella pneumoniae TaxID=573 RepID=UPI000D1B906C|nr:hypothetical protein [Klebsiella pneumoniae]